MAWSEIQGQEFVVKLLRADLAAQRVAPAYLFVGDTDAGMQAVSLEMARALNCAASQPSHGACSCDSCRRITRGVHPDVHHLNPQGAAANIRIEDVRQVLQRMSLRPFMARAQVAVINGAECLTEEAGNLLLKSLEEAPPTSRFILLTPQPSACLPTIVSRCKLIRFRRTGPQFPHDRQSQPSQAIRALLGSGRKDAWLEWAIPADRQELSQCLSSAVSWVRDQAVAGVGNEPADLDRYIDAGLRLITLWHSLDEQMVSSRLIGTLLREEWRKLSI